jgi:outer membrane protein OmpA-like peptidoglycan-associated protein
MKKIKLFSVVYIIMLFIIEVNASYKYEELLIPAGVRATGCGKNFVSMYDTAEGLFYNPSLATMVPYGELTLGYNMFYANSSLQDLACSFPLGSIGFGIVGRMFFMPELDVIKNYEVGDKFKQTMLEGGGMFAVKPFKNISFGISAKYVEKSIYTQNESALLYDTGVVIKTTNDMFSIAGSLLNYSFSNSEFYPTNYNLGIKFKFDLPQQTKISFLVSTQIDYHNNKPVYNFGIEHWESEILGVRLGYVYDKDKIESKIFDQISYFTAGFSLKLGNFGIDYTYSPNSVLGTTHNIGVNLRFMGKKKEVKTISLPCELIVEPQVFSPNNDGYLDNIFFRHNVSTYTHLVEISYIVKNINGDTMVVIKSSAVTTEINKFFVYDGKTLDGKVLPDGVYTAEVILKDQTEDKLVVYESQKKEFVVDTQPPDVEIKVSTGTFSPDNDGVNDTIEFYININDNLSYIDKLDANIFTIQDKKVYSYKIDVSTMQKSLSLTLSWDGKDEIYNKVVPNGRYKLVINTKDVAGNKTVKEASFNVYTEEKPKVVVEKEEKLFYIKGAKIILDERGIVVIFSTDELFDKEGHIKSEKYELLSSLAEIIKERYSDKKIFIEGHTDSVGDEQENKKKSSMYAWAVYSYFVKNLGLDGAQFKVKGWGEERPIASNKTKLGRAQNRRIEIIIPK